MEAQHATIDELADKEIVVECWEDELTDRFVINARIAHGADADELADFADTHGLDVMEHGQDMDGTTRVTLAEE